MSEGSYMRALIRCPYYRTDDGRRKVECEGIVPDTVISSRFRHRADYEQQIRVFCAADYWRCEICAALDAKYEKG